MNSLADKYAPKRAIDVLNQNIAVQKIKEFLLDDRKTKKAIILYGPSGTGKTSAVSAVADEMNFDLIKLGWEEFQNKDSVINAVTTASIFGNKKLILIDDIESLDEIFVLNNLIKISKFSIIIIALDVWSPKLKSLRPLCELIEFKKLPIFFINNFLTNVLKKENIKFDKEVVDFISKNSNGDVRAALNDLDAVIDNGIAAKEDIELLEERNHGADIFSSMQKIFQSKNRNEILSALDNLDMDFDTASLWISENIPNAYKTPEEISKSYEALSRSDVFIGRINKRQYQGFFYYANLLATAGVSVSGLKKETSFIKYNKPSKIMKLFETKAYRHIIKSIAKKVSVVTHTSLKTAEKDYINMLRFMFKSKNKQVLSIAETIGLDSSEIEFLSA
jgi:replication factor C large subunit